LTSKQAVKGNIGGPLDFFGTFAFNMGLSYGTAAVGSGISSALAPGGSFTAGLTFSATATPTTGFISGAITGAGTGAFGSFVGGIGNSLLNGSSFKGALNTGIEDGIRGALTGLAIGGLSGGIHAASKGRDFWTGNARLYDADPGLVASLNNGAYGEASSPFYSVYNGSDHDIYYKPENGIYGLNNKIPPGKILCESVDGIATSKYSNMVFKIPGKAGLQPSAAVRQSGDVFLDFGPFDSGALLWKEFRDPNYIYGWIHPHQIDDSWGMLFNLARIIR
jgi:hypothetical protein